MKWWMRERDQLIEQTLAFVEGVAAARPKRAGAAGPGPTEPSKSAEPPRPVQSPTPAAINFMASERTEIQKRVANFKAQQQKFQREREANYDAIFSKARATPGNPARP